MDLDKLVLIIVPALLGLQQLLLMVVLGRIQSRLGMIEKWVVLMSKETKIHNDLQQVLDDLKSRDAPAPRKDDVGQCFKYNGKTYVTLHTGVDERGEPKYLTVLVKNDPDLGT